MTNEIISFTGAFLLILAIGFLFRAGKGKGRDIRSHGVYRHIKSGREYVVLCDNARFESTTAPCVVYTSVETVETPEPWVRDYNEFYDGRFDFVRVITLVNGKLEK